MAAQQLTLVEEPKRPHSVQSNWRLDERTIERGKKGVEHARAVLAQSVARAEARRAADRDRASKSTAA